MEKKDNIKKRIDEIYDNTVEIRRDLHMHPELSEHEVRTAEKISGYLSRWGIEHRCGVAGNGIVAWIEGRKPPQGDLLFRGVGIRADMDALPVKELADVPFRSVNEGVMHACGHDIHTAVALGSARILKEMESEFSGAVKFFFQPSEETVGGAERMIAEGCLLDPPVDAVAGLHVAPLVPSGDLELCRGRMNAASTEFELTVSGKSCHGAHPDDGADPILAASHIVAGLQSIISRNLSPANPGLITVGKFISGTANNVIPEKAVLSGIIRALDNETQRFIKDRLLSFASSTAEAFGARADIYFRDSYPALVNDDFLLDTVREAAQECLGSDRIHFMPEPSLGSDDFSYFSTAVRSLYFNLGTKKDGGPSSDILHSAYYCPDEESMKSGMLIEIMSVLRLLDMKGSDCSGLSHQ